ncbi:MAG TPA: aldehyde ferredoxin oxidoreductase family protein [Candidatus Limivicinus faecipullorum]|nr:aldehyde ferredoxin oxidoreductase family protein [Candidatus Limivicinus faecipullorum]
MTKYSGYMGKLLMIDLSEGSEKEYPWTDRDRELYLGGKAVASKIMYDNFTGREDPFSEENLIIISTGPVTGTFAPSSNRFDISSLSPLTGISSSSNCGGDFGFYLKKAGLDALIIRGKSEKPIWIEIDDGKLSYHPAEELRGMRTGETQAVLRKKLAELHGPKGRYGMVSIGPAGENLVRYAAVISGERAAGRAGIGAVFGSKNIKAIVASGSHEIKLHDKEKSMEHHKKWTAALKAHPITGAQLPRLGTAGLVSSMQMNGQLATRNFSAGRFEDFEKVSGEALAEEENISNSGCLSCPIRCSRTVDVDGKKVKGPELETLGLMGANLANGDIKLVCRWNHELDELGMDSISCAGTIAWAMEANEKGLWDNGLKFGQVDDLSRVLEDIAFRRGIGDELAEGSKRLSDKYGGKDFAIQSKGMELSAYEPRRAVGQGLGYAVSNRGGCHLNGGYLVVLEGLGLNIDRQTPKAKADLCMFMQDFMEAISLCGHCLFTSYAVFPGFLISKANSPIPRFVNFIIPHCGWAVRMLNKLPGMAFMNMPLIPYTYELKYAVGMKMNIGRFLRIGERSYNVERAVNARFGVSAEKDKLPKRLTDVLQDPKDPHSRVPLEKMKKVYYRARGWGSDGLPSRKKLRSLGIR